MTVSDLIQDLISFIPTSKSFISFVSYSSHLFLYKLRTLNKFWIDSYTNVELALHVTIY